MLASCLSAEEVVWVSSYDRDEKSGEQALRLGGGDMIAI